MTMTFTPGPWEAYGDLVTAGEHGATFICEDVGDANAKLIAAAPELYAALEALLISDRNRDRAKAALSKARGEA